VCVCFFIDFNVLWTGTHFFIGEIHENSYENLVLHLVSSGPWKISRKL